MKNWFWALVVGAIGGLAYWVVATVLSLDQTATVIVVLVITVVAQYIHQRIETATGVEDNLGWTTLHVVTTLVGTYILFLVGAALNIIAAVNIGVSFFIAYFVLWLVVTAFQGGSSSQRAAAGR